LLRWGTNNFVAFACGKSVAVLENEHWSLVQSIWGEGGMLTVLEWKPGESFEANQQSLLTGDTMGNVRVYDIISGSEIYHIPPLYPKAIVDVAWVTCSRRTMLLVLYQHGVLALFPYLTPSTEPLWRESLPEKTKSMSVSADTQVAYIACESDWIYVVSNVANFPETSIQVERKYRVGSGAKGSKDRASDLKKVMYWSHETDCLLLVFTKEILFFDVLIHQLSGHLSLDSNAPQFVDAFVTSSHQHFYTLQEDGAASCWYRSGQGQFKFSNIGRADISRLAHSNQDASHFTAALAVSPWSESEILALSRGGALTVARLGERDGDTPAVFSPAPSVKSPVVSRNLRNRGLSDRFFIQSKRDAIGAGVTAVCVRSPSACIGLASGIIQIVDLEEQRVKLEAKVLESAVLGIRWISRTTLLCYSSRETPGTKCFVNRVVSFHCVSGTVTDVRKFSTDERAQIRGIRCSDSGKYLVVLMKDKPSELWDLVTYSIIRTFRFASEVMSLEWSTMSLAIDSADCGEDVNLNNAASGVDAIPTVDTFTILLADGVVQSYVIDNNTTKAVGVVSATLGTNNPTLLAWHHPYVVVGDSSGFLHVLHAPSQEIWAFQLSRQAIRTLKFSSLSSDYFVIAVSQDGMVYCVDIKGQSQVSGGIGVKSERFLDADWAAPKMPLLLHEDGSLHIVPLNLRLSRLPILRKNLLGPFSMTGMDIARCRAVAEAGLLGPFDMHGSLNAQHCLEFISGFPTVVQWRDSLAPIISQRLRCQEIYKRLANVARYFGDAECAMMWTALEHHSAYGKLDDTDTAEDLPRSFGDALSEHRSAEKVEASTVEAEQSALLPAPISFVRSKQALQDVLSRQLSSRVSAEPSREIMHLLSAHHVFMGDLEGAIGIQLRTPVDDPCYVEDALRACVIAAASSQKDFHDIVKLVGSQLISAGKLYAGCELLFLIGRGLDALRYLQQVGRWKEAAIIARTGLSQSDFKIVFQLWAEKLIDERKLFRAATVYISAGMYGEAVKLLADAGEVASAFFLMQLTMESVSTPEIVAKYEAFLLGLGEEE
jgi:WD40 repeat protein